MAIGGQAVTVERLVQTVVIYVKAPTMDCRGLKYPKE
jgi:hypothetical protein